MRRRWRRSQRQLDPRRLVFLDETAISTSMTRRSGRSARGQRLVCKVPFGSWQSVTMVAALRHDRVTAPMTLNGAMTGESFRSYISQVLGPTLRIKIRAALDAALPELSDYLPLAVRREAGENLQPFDMLRQLFLRACIQSHERAEERAICNDNRHTDVCPGAHVLTGRQHRQVRVGEHVIGLKWLNRAGHVLARRGRQRDLKT